MKAAKPPGADQKTAPERARPEDGITADLETDQRLMRVEKMGCTGQS